MKTLYYQCENPDCKWFRQLIILKAPEIAPGAIEVPNLVCDCGFIPTRLRVRGGQ